MSILEKVILGLVLLFLVVACLRLLAAPLKLALRVVANGALGFGALWLLQLTGLPGLTLGLNLFNTLVIGVLGLPGLGLLLMLQWVLTT